MNQEIETALNQLNKMPKEEVERLAYLEESRLLTKRVLAGKTDFLEVGPEKLNITQLKKTRNKIFITYLKRLLKCGRCDESNPVCIEFHHENHKTLSVSTLVHKSYPIESIVNEIKKCVVLCANCHKKEHNSDSQFSDKDLLGIGA